VYIYGSGQPYEHVIMVQLILCSRSLDMQHCKLKNQSLKVTDPIMIVQLLEG